MAIARLLLRRRFAPLFATQFLGALNDNLFKNALLVLATFHTAASTQQSAVLVNLAAGLFIAPFFLLSPLAGQLADKIERSRLIRTIKLAEIAVMVLGAAALLLGSVPLMLLALAAMGAQSAFFGPVKYAILPQHLHRDELVSGNALVELGTFLAILLGTTLGGLAMSRADGGPIIVAAAVLAVAAAGWCSSRAIPPALPPSPDLVLNHEPFGAAADTFRHARQSTAVWLSVMGISWFWFVGALILAQVPGYTRGVLHTGPQVATLLLVAFSLGIGLGALLCARLSGRLVELGLVPIGAAGMTVFALDLAFAYPGSLAPAGAALADAAGFLASPGAWRVLFDVVALAASAGVYVVPLYAYVQQSTEEASRARVIAANNMMNALFMVAAALTGAGLLAAGLAITHLFITVAVMNVAVAVFIFTRVPEFLIRLLVWALVHSVYRIEREALEHIPLQGPALLVCNHVSFVDALLIAAVSPRPVRFVMDHRIFATRLLNPVFRASRAIPIAPAHEDAQMLERAYDAIAAALEQGELVCIFPEGRITSDGEINPFKPGVERIVQRTPVEVVPLALRGLWGSFFSRHAGRAMRGLPRRLWSRIAVVSGPPVPAAQVSAAGLQRVVAGLRGERR
jgi:1-acyl-sn-glycerol-3-phosphate acyltransferase